MNFALRWAAAGFLLSIGMTAIATGASLVQMKPTRTATDRSGSLKKPTTGIDSGQRDYGAKLEQWRSRAVRCSLASPLFYTLLAGCLVLLMALAALLHQSRERERREIVAAEFLAQYHNAWVYATRQAQDAIARHNQLAQKLNRAGEAAEAGNASALVARAEVVPEPTSSAAALFLKSSFRPHSEQASAGDVRQASGVRGGPRESEPDLIAQIGILQDQLKAAGERQRALEKELSRIAPPKAQATERNTPAHNQLRMTESKRERAATKCRQDCGRETREESAHEKE